MSKANTIFIGLDVQKETIDVACVSENLEDVALNPFIKSWHRFH
ncbi:hypothetical protein [Shewanella algae]